MGKSSVGSIIGRLLLAQCEFPPANSIIHLPLVFGTCRDPTSVCLASGKPTPVHRSIEVVPYVPHEFCKHRKDLGRAVASGCLSAQPRKVRLFGVEGSEQEKAPRSPCTRSAATLSAQNVWPSSKPASYTCRQHCVAA